MSRGVAWGGTGHCIILNYGWLSAWPEVGPLFGPMCEKKSLQKDTTIQAGLQSFWKWDDHTGALMKSTTVTVCSQVRGDIYGVVYDTVNPAMCS